MNKTLRDVAKVLYEVENSLCCKVCVRCKEKEGNRHLSCVDCVEEGICTLIDRNVQLKTSNGIGTDGEPKFPRGFEICECGGIVHELDIYCSYCGHPLKSVTKE